MFVIKYLYGSDIITIFWLIIISVIITAKVTIIISATWMIVFVLHEL